MNLHLKEANRVLDQIQPYITRDMAAIIVGYDGNYMMSVHLRPLADGEATPDTVWSQNEYVRYNLEGYKTNAYAIAAAVRLRWPSVKVYDCACTCCGESLHKVTEECIATEYLDAA